MCEIFESRVTYLNRIFKFSPYKFHSASLFRGYANRDKSKCFITCPTDAETVKLFERTLMGTFRSVNMHLAFDSQILLQKNHRDNMKSISKIKTDGGKNEKKRISTKNLKLMKTTRMEKL